MAYAPYDKFKPVVVKINKRSMNFPQNELRVHSDKFITPC